MAGEVRSAIEDFGEALRLQPTDADAYWHRGRAYEAIRERAEAARDYLRALECAPGDWPLRARAQDRLDRLRG